MTQDSGLPQNPGDPDNTDPEATSADRAEAAAAEMARKLEQPGWQALVADVEKRLKEFNDGETAQVSQYSHTEPVALLFSPAGGNLRIRAPASPAIWRNICLGICYSVCSAIC